MLSLRKHIRSNQFGIRGFVRDDKYFAGSRYHIHRNVAEHLLFRKSYEHVAGSGYKIDPFNAFRTVSERRNSLCAADFIYLLYSAFRARNEDERVLYIGSSNDYFADARRNCGKRRHKHGRRIARLSAGYVKSDSRKRSVYPAESTLSFLSAFEKFVLVFIPLLSVIRKDIFFRAAKAFDKLVVNACVRRFYFLFRHQKVFCIYVRLIEFFRIVEQRLIAVLTYVCNYLSYSARKLCVAQLSATVHSFHLVCAVFYYRYHISPLSFLVFTSIKPFLRL